MSQLSRGGFHPEAILAQAVLETGWMDHMPAPYNYWGMKAPRWWSGKTTQTPTHEYVNGVYTSTMSTWVAFDNISSAFQFYARQINKLYPAAWAHRSVPPLFFQGLQSGFKRKDGTVLKWSTNKAYATMCAMQMSNVYNKKNIMDLLKPRIVEFLEVTHSDDVLDGNKFS